MPPKEEKLESEKIEKVITMQSPQFFASAIQPINLKDSNQADVRKNWQNQFKIFLRAARLDDQTDQRKVALLLHHMGPEALLVFNSFNLDVDEVKYSELVPTFDAYFMPKMNIAIERHKFFTIKQEANESIDEYATVLKNLSLNCKFETLREDLVKDIFICERKNRS